jgi:two-component system, chemotaxis family, protein-glutamate methylesterase/glutaminase
MKNLKKISVLIVDDSLTVRKTIAKILNQTLDIIVKGEAKNGKEAIELNDKLNPDVILMDIVMPVMNGLSATEYIMSHKPTAIIIHSSSNQRGEMYKTFDALATGALALVEKSLANTDYETWQMELEQTIRAASHIKVRKKNKIVALGEIKSVGIRRQRSGNDFNIIAMGASTGGPGILLNILKPLSFDFRVPILLVLHIAKTRTNTFANWLDENCNLDVRFAVDGESINGYAGRVFIAPPEKHMVVQAGRIKLLDSKPVNFCKPSVDVLFNALAKDKTVKPIAVLLTGMGDDGAKGLKNIRASKGYTICQDKKTSIVFGMPKKAIELDAAMQVLPDYKIIEKIYSLLKKK